MLQIIALPYSQDLIDHYHQLSNLPGFVFLDSSDRQRGRYDIVSAYPYDRVSISLKSEHVIQEYQELHRRLETLKKNSTCDLPFQGGAIGFISYDFGEKITGLESAPHPVLNNMPILDMYFYDWALIADHHARKLLLVAQNHHDNTPQIVNEIQRRWNNCSQLHSSFSLTQSFSPLIEKSEYQQAVSHIHEDLRSGRAYQVNYTQPFLAEYQGDPWEMYKEIRTRNPVPFSAFLRSREGDLLSFSPERFLLLNDGCLQTSPIKGSIKRSTCPNQDKALLKQLMDSCKDHAENIMIVDLLRNDLGKISIPGSVKVKNLCEAQSYNAVHHLVSTIEAQCLPTYPSSAAFLTCFPGGSITGAPKREAMYIINEHEPFSRGVYCGSIVYFSSHGRFDSNIAIRTMTARHQSLYLVAGGGITIDSAWEEEYQECYTKIAAIVNQLNSNF